MIALVVAAALAVAVVVGQRVIRALQARVATLEARTDADAKWQEEVRKAIAAVKH